MLLGYSIWSLFSLQYIIIKSHWERCRDKRQGEEVSRVNKWEIDIIIKALDMVINVSLEKIFESYPRWGSM